MPRKPKPRERTNETLLLMAYGAEEMETVIIIDILRRAGVSVRVAGENEIVTCSRGVKIIPDVLFDDVLEDEYFDAIIIPGGSEAVESLAAHPHIEKLLHIQQKRNGIIAAICAAPTLIAHFGLAKHSTALTSHPSVERLLSKFVYLQDSVVIDRNIITSRGAGTAIEFALTLVEILADSETKDRIATDIVYTSPKNAEVAVENSNEETDENLPV